MTTTRLPSTDSIDELARFWDKNDLTDFEDQLVEAPAGTFGGQTELSVTLAPEELHAIRAQAEASGLTETELIRTWILERLNAA